jgi:hypothetical protein
MDDPELDAMGAMLNALDPLEPGARERVLNWAAAKWEVQLGPATRGRRSTQLEADDETDGREFSDVADLVHAAQPSNGPQRALVVGYWFQELQGRDGWSGADINSTLKNMGSGLSNVTKTLESLKAKRPALVMQVGKMGRSRQARKTYKLTSAGVNEVRRMLASASAGAGETEVA